MNKLKIDEYKYRLWNSINIVGPMWFILSPILIWAIINHFSINKWEILWKNDNVFKNPVFYALMVSWLWLFIVAREFIKSRKDDEWFENYLITKDVDANIRKSKIQKSIQENIMNNLKDKLDDETSHIIDNNTPAEMERARQDLLVLNIQMDYIEWKIDTIYKLQKRIKHLIRNKK